MSLLTDPRTPSLEAAGSSVPLALDPAHLDSGHLDSGQLADIANSQGEHLQAGRFWLTRAVVRLR